MNLMTTNIMTASNQWASRPDDERFTSLDALLAHTKSQRATSAKSPSRSPPVWTTSQSCPTVGAKMLAEEALFDGHPVAHVVAYYERMVNDSRFHALRALRDCTVVRANPFHPGYSDLVRRGYATRQEKRVKGREVADYRMTESGAAIAAVLFA